MTSLPDPISSADRRTRNQIPTQTATAPVLAARALSAVLGILTLCAAATLPGSSLSRTARLALPLLIAASPGAAWYDREARSYALLLLLSTVITLASVRFLRAKVQEDCQARHAILMLMVAALLASFTHYFGFLLAAAAFLTCFLLTERRRMAMVAWAGCSLVVSFVPWLAYHFQFIDVGRVTWIRAFPIVASLNWFAFLAFGGVVSLALFVSTAAVLLATGGRHRLAAWNSTVFACALLCLLVLTAAAAISLYMPVLTSRNMIVALPALYVIAAELTSGLVSCWGKLAGVPYLVAQVGLMGQSVVWYYTAEINDQWRDSAAFVLHTPGCERGPIAVYGSSEVYRFFTKSVRPELRLIEIPAEAAADLGSWPTTSCPILLWAVEVAAWDLDQLLARLGLSHSGFEMVEYHNAFVVLRK